jgi:uncharacterized protein YukJ
VVGKVDVDTEKPIMGRSGDHLQFYVDINTSLRYQVDVNTESKDGTDVLVFVADEEIPPDPTNPPFGLPAFGVFPAPETKLSYAALGLTDAEFTAVSDTRIESQLEAALGQSDFVAIHGFIFDDGGADGKGIHETHFNPGKANQDGAVVVYLTPQPGQALTRRWFFFKFQDETIGT